MGFSLHPQRSASGPGLRTYSLVGKVRKRVQRSALRGAIKCHYATILSFYLLDRTGSAMIQIVTQKSSAT